MLSSADQGLVRRDSALPGLSLVLDPEAMAETLGNIFVEGAIESVRIRSARYAPGVSCLVTLELQCGNTLYQVYAQAYRREVAEKFRNPRIRKTVAGPLGPGRIVLGNSAVVAFFFPNDNNLRALPQILGRDVFRQVFPSFSRFSSASIQVLRYEPEHRFEGQVNADGSPQAVICVYTRPGFEAVLHHSTVLVDRGPLSFPAVLMSSKDHNALLFRWTECRTMNDLLEEGELKTDSVSLAGAALSEFHGQAGRGLPPLAYEELLQAKAGLVKTLCPALAGRIDGFLGRAVEEINGWRATAVPVHGRLSPDEICILKDKVTFNDLERAALAAPVWDLGSLLAHLEHRVICGSLAAGKLAALSSTFLSAYRNASKIGAAAHEPGVALGLFQLLDRPFNERAGDWPELTEMMLSRAEQLLKGDAALVPEAKPRKESNGINSLLKGALGLLATLPSSKKGVMVVDAYGVMADPILPHLNRALSPETVEGKIKQRFPDPFQKCRLREIRVTQYKPRKRCSLEYTFVARKTQESIGLLAITPDFSGFGAQKALWEGRFAYGSKDKIMVARPFGSIPELQMWFQERIAGELSTELLAAGNASSLAEKIAIAARKLHQSGLPAMKTRTIADELSLLRDRLALVSHKKPEWSLRLERILDGCQKLAAATSPSAACTVHGDFHSDHIMIQNDRLYVLDFESCCEGDPAMDLGNFLGHLREMALRRLGDPDALTECEEIFRETYLELSGIPLRQPIRTYSTLTLAGRIYAGAESAEGDLFGKDLMDLCEKRLDIGSPSAAPARSQPVFRVR